MFFEKPSTRTRLSFEIGMTQLGGHAIYFGKDSQLAAGNEDLLDTANVLSRYADFVMARVYQHDTVAKLAEYASIPIINALSDVEHPCQALADLQTVQENHGWSEETKVAYIGDGNNVCNSLALACAYAGVQFAAATPQGYEADAALMNKAKQVTNNGIQLTTKPEEAVEGASVVYTDTWISMGQEEEKQKRIADFKGFQVDAALMNRAKPNATFMHCLPAHKGYEVSKDVIEGPQSVVYQQAENRLHAQKALLLFLAEQHAKT